MSEILEKLKTELVQKDERIRLLEAELAKKAKQYRELNNKVKELQKKLDNLSKLAQLEERLREIKELSKKKGKYWAIRFDGERRICELKLEEEARKILDGLTAGAEVPGARYTFVLLSYREDNLNDLTLRMEAAEKALQDLRQDLKTGIETVKRLSKLAKELPDIEMLKAWGVLHERENGESA